MQLGHDDLGRRNALFRVQIDGDSTPVVVHGNAGIGVNRDDDAVGVTRQSLVDAVIDDLVHHVVQAGAVVGVADIHTGTLSDRF